RGCKIRASAPCAPLGGPAGHYSRVTAGPRACCCRREGTNLAGRDGSGSSRQGSSHTERSVLASTRLRESLMLTVVAHITVVPRTALLGSCELCDTEAVYRAAIVVVKHPRGGNVNFAVCDRCALVVRRVAAAAGGHAWFTAHEEGGGPEVIEERAELLRDADGTEYLVVVCGRRRSYGMWEGWIEFLALGTAASARTAVETTQPSRADLAYCASGLEPLYFEGAFRCAHPARPVA